MSETHTGQQLGVKRTTAGGGADSEARRASRLVGDDENRDHEQEDAPRSFLLILLRALGAMHS
jgi:hypothetical protein